MDFALTPELKAIQQLAGEIARAEVGPRAADIDERGIFPWDVFRTFADAGLLGVGIPEAYGGSGLGTMGLVLAVEQVNLYCSTSAAILVMADLPLIPILLAGTDQQKRKYATGTAQGEIRGAICMTESDAGSDVANLQTTAQFTGREYVLNGTKAFISGAEEADFLTVLARTDPEAGHNGFSVFVVDADNPGVSVGKTEVKLGVKGLPVYEVRFEDCAVPFTARLGEENRGFQLIMQTLNRARPVLAARGLGLAEGALMHWLQYARERKAFGRPIAEHQGLQWMAADLAAQIEAVRSLVYRAASLVDAGHDGREHAHILSAAKLLASELAVKASNDCLQMMGGVGYMESYPLARFLRDAKQLTIVEGTSQVQKNIIGASLLDGLVQYS